MLLTDGKYTMVCKKRAFTLVELMVAILLSAIIVFFSYTMTISAYKMFTKMNNTSYSIDNIKFFEEVFKKSVSEAEDTNFTSTTTSDLNELRFERYDTKLPTPEKVIDVYTLDDENGNTLSFMCNDANKYEVYPSSITDFALRDITPVKLFVETTNSSGTRISRMLLLNNVKAFYYRVDKTGDTKNLRDITIGIVYYDDSTKTLKRQNRSFCFTARGIVA